MFDAGTGPDPYVIYKLHHAWRAEKAWMVSADLGLYEVFRDGSLAPAQVCAKLGLQPRPVSVLLAANACMGILGLADGKYFLHDSVRELMLKDGRAYYPPTIPAPGADLDFDRWKQTILTNRPLEEDEPDWIRHPCGSPGVTAHIPGRHGWRVLWGEALAKAFDFGPYKLAADLGGATGGLLVGLTGQYPHLKGVVVDLPYGQATAQAAIEADGAAARVSYLAADFFTDPYPAGADVLLMSHILHDWDDAHCLKLLRRCHAALPSGCPVIVQEFLLNHDKTGPTLAVFQWFGMLRGTMGDQRTADETAALLRQAGFAGIETRPIDQEQSIVIGWK